MSITEFLQNFLPDCASRKRALSAKYPGLNPEGIDSMMIMYFPEALQNFADRICEKQRDNCKIAYQQFADNYVEFAQRWISVDEELPEIGQLVLVKNKSDDISTARRGRVKFVIDFFDMRSDEITHWRCIELK
jgi:hypothetical protein